MRSWNEIAIFICAATAAGLSSALGVLASHDRWSNLWMRAEAWVDARRSEMFAGFSARRLLMGQAMAVGLFLGLSFLTERYGLLALAVLAGVAPPIMLVRTCRKRRERLEEQLEKTVFDLSDALKAAGGVGEALARVAEHSVAPMRDELFLVLREVRFGVSLESALEGMVNRSKSHGAAAVATALSIGRRTGGDLPRILEEMAATFREQKRLEGVLRTKTAEGRGQAWVLGIIPPALIAFLSVSNPTWLEPLWSDPFGWIILGTGAVMELLAVLLIRKLVAFSG